MAELLALLAHREYRKYAAASLLAATGSGIYFVAISWYLYQLSGSAMTVAWTFILSTLPGLLFSPWIGVLVDRWNVRRICAFTDMCRAAILALAAVGMAFRALDLHAVYAMTFLLALCDNFFQPAVGALVRDVAPRERLLAANVVGNMSMQIGTLAGAGLGGWLVSALDTGWIIAANAGSFLLSGLLILAIAHRPAPPAAGVAGPSTGMIAEFRQALRYAADSSFVFALAVDQMLVYLTLFLCNTLLPVFVGRELGAGAAAFGLIDAAWGAGAVAGGLALSHLGRRVRAGWFGPGALALLAGMLLVFLTARHAAQAAVAYFFLGSLAVMIRIHSDTVLAMQLDPAYFGKVKAAISMFISTMSVPVYAAVGQAGDKVSVKWIYLTLAAVIVAVVLWQTLRRLLGGGAVPAGTPE